MISADCGFKLLYSASLGLVSLHLEKRRTRMVTGERSGHRTVACRNVSDLPASLAFEPVRTVDPELSVHHRHSCWHRTAGHHPMTSIRLLGLSFCKSRRAEHVHAPDRPGHEPPFGRNISNSTKDVVRITPQCRCRQTKCSFRLAFRSVTRIHLHTYHHPLTLGTAATLIHTSTSLSGQ